MDVETGIKNSLQTMNSEALVALHDKLEALYNHDVADDAQPVWKSTREMCKQLITQRAVAAMREEVIATVHKDNLSVEDRIDLIISIMEDCFQEVRATFCDNPFTMFFEELAGAERFKTSKIETPHSLGRMGTGGWGKSTFSSEARTSSAGTEFIINIYTMAVLSSCGGNGKIAGKLSIANIQAIVAVASAGASQANPPARKEE
ncbi:hypothetical protein BGZ72_002184 [Mortierella alpina]|nr:hypothetical protein BGZ72_002184 [Mortierella alpina]